MAQTSIRVPPDSTGKRVATTVVLDVQYTNLSGDIQINDRVVGATSGFLGTVAHVIETTATAGTVSVQLDHDAPEAVVNGETLSFIGAAPTGTATVVGTGTPQHHSHAVVVGGNNSYNTQYVDARGSAYVRFPDGAATLNAFGSLLTASSETIGVYDFSADGADDLFSEILRNGGSGSYLASKSSYELRCTTSSGSVAARLTNKYHFYWPGRGLGCAMTVACGDTGIENNARRWGMFDAQDGVFFELSGSVPCVVVRRTVEGVMEEYRVPQSEWNVDKLDGTGVSRETLRVNKITPYIIDYQWLGAGRVRYGIIGPDGGRIYCHVVENSGKNPYPYLNKGSSPITVSSVNFGVTGAEPTIRFTCAVAQNEGVTDYTYWRYTYEHDAVAVTGSMHPLISLRSKLTYQGKHNQTNAYPENYNCCVSGGRVKIQFYWPAELTGSAWANDNGSTVEADTAATFANADPGDLFRTYFLGEGCHEINLAQFFEKNDEGILAQANGDPSVPFCVVASLTSGSAASVTGAISYKELR